MTPDVNAIKARADAASPGPWVTCDFNEGTSHPALWGVVNPPYFNPLDHPDQQAAEVQISVGCYEDAEFIAHAREDVLTLIAELTVIRRERAWLLANLSEAELADFRLLAQTAERAREDRRSTPRAAREVSQ